MCSASGYTPVWKQFSWGHQRCQSPFCSVLNSVVRPQFPNSWNSEFKTFFHLWIKTDFSPKIFILKKLSWTFSLLPCKHKTGLPQPRIYVQSPLVSHSFQKHNFDLSDTSNYNFPGGACGFRKWEDLGVRCSPMWNTTWPASVHFGLNFLTVYWCSYFLLNVGSKQKQSICIWVAEC